MGRLLLRRLVAVFFFSTTAAVAAPMSPDPTGYWYVPSESGWGLSIAQQNDVLFATLLVYDEERRPMWLAASNVRAIGGGVFTGTLFRTSGPSFAGAFDPATVKSESVGLLRLEDTGDPASLRLTYSVNGVLVTRTISRLTWETNATRLVGGYFGGTNLSLAPLPQPAGCADPPALFPPGGEIHINLAAPDTIAIIRGEGVDVLHILGGTYRQSGQLGTITGALFSGIVVSPQRLGDATVTNLLVTDDGFLGHLRVTANGCVYEGPIAGNRRSP